MVVQAQLVKPAKQATQEKLAQLVIRAIRVTQGQLVQWVLTVWMVYSEQPEQRAQLATLDILVIPATPESLV